MTRILPALSLLLCLVALGTAFPRFAAAQQELIYAALYDENNLGVVDPAQDKLVRRIQVGRNPDMVALNADRSKLYVSNTGEVTVSIVHLAESRVSQVLRLPVNRRNIWAGPLTRNPAGTRVYVAERAENNEELRVYVIDTEKELITGQFDAGKNISAVSVSHDGAKIFVVNKGEGIGVYDAATLAKIGSVEMPKGQAVNVTGFACSPVTPVGYATYGPANTMQIVSTDTYKSVSVLPMPKYKTGVQKDVLVSPDGNLVFMVTHKSNLKEVDGINVYDARKKEIMKIFNSGVCDRGMTVTPDGKTFYVAADMLKWYNLETLEHIRSISLRTNIHGIAVVPK